MGMGYVANSASVIEEKDIRKIGKCKQFLTDLQVALKKIGSDMESFAYDRSIETLEELTEDAEARKNIENSYSSLLKEFKKQTKMELCLGFHNQEDEGDRYDEVAGVYWHVYGYCIISPAGIAAKKKFKINIDLKSFVSFG